MKIKNTSLLLLFTAILAACAGTHYRDSTHSDRSLRPALYEPYEQQVLLFIGQDLGAIGGLKDYTQGYMNEPNLPKPVGFTTYTSFGSWGSNSGLMNLDNWGAGDEHADRLLEHPAVTNPMISIGLYLDPNIIEAIGSGEFDPAINELGSWIKKAKNPVLLRIGYEFEFNGYEPEDYVTAYRRIVDLLDKNKVKNISFVWQAASMTSLFTKEGYELYYPGDNYVDWVAYSYFYNSDQGQLMIDFAREHNKPVFLSETCPARFDLKESTYGNEVDPAFNIRSAAPWEEWFEPMFEWVELNKDVIKAVAYINVDWMSQPMWQDPNSPHYPYWMGTDSRIQSNTKVAHNWTQVINAKDSRWITNNLTKGLVHGY